MIMFGKLLFARTQGCLLLTAALVTGMDRVQAAETNATPPPTAAASASAPQGMQSYRLTANDLVRVRVFQEDDLTTELRLGKDGSATFPLLGVINLAGKTVEEAAASLREALGKDYLVNPQVTLTVVEYAKRRFTVLGQVQKPGSYELPSEESVTLLQAIAMAGGFTRLAVQGKVTVTRTMGGRKTLVVDVKSNANDPSTKQFDIQPDDTIIVAERVF
jgi:protein involved in polysaccharide export with SLBB domain